MPPWTPENIPSSYTYAGDWYDRKERTPNDYRENPINEYQGFTPEEEQAYWEEISKEDNPIF